MLQSEIIIPYLPRGWLNTIHHHLVQHRIKVEFWNSWVPTIQHKEDLVIMDVVHHRIPSWVWGGINRCRLFLQANTITDLTTIDGQYVPVNIRKVVDRICESTLLFPLQQKPSKGDIQQWRFFIDLITNNGHLHVPLGQWSRLPGQSYRYMRSPSTETIYIKDRQQWQCSAN